MISKETKMYRLIYIAAFSVLFIICKCEENNKCKVLTDPPIESMGLTEEAIRKVSDDADYVTENIHEFIAELRDTIENDELPPDTIKYYSFTSGKKQLFDLTKTTIPFNTRKPIVFVIHGFIRSSNLEIGLTGDLIQGLVKLDKYNVIAVDYANLNNGVLSQVVPRVFVAAKDMARFLQFIMKETGTKSEQIHVIGLSLGGQISGMVGRFLPGLGRITGLDPGGSIFNNLPKDLRLDRSDANFVDVVHTSAEYPLPKGWGYSFPCGHLDFYVNGGKIQPGCNLTIPIEQTPRTKEEMASRVCMHQRLAIYFTESMCGNCTFVGTLCDSYENFERGKCTPSNAMTAVMGELAKKPAVDLPEDAKFFLNTNDHYPFCKPEQPGRSSRASLKEAWTSLKKLFW